MPQPTETLKAYDNGSYSELSARPLPPGLVLQFIPSLAALLTNVQDTLEEPLTRKQVLLLRDHASVVVCKMEAAREVDERRGYADLNPERAWEDWTELQERSEDAD